MKASTVQRLTHITIADGRLRQVADELVIAGGDIFLDIDGVAFGKVRELRMELPRETLDFGPKPRYD